MLKQRILTAAVLAPLVVAGIFYLPFEMFVGAIAIVTLLGHWEWTKFVTPLSRIKHFITPAILLAVSLVALPFDVSSLNLVVSGATAVALIGALWWLLASGMVLSYPNKTAWWRDSGVMRQVFGVLTLLPFMWSVLYLRAQEYNVDSLMGAKLVLLVCLLVWSADSGAYFAGKRFGKRKMAPNVSPNKTIEGLLGGMLAAMVVTVTFADLLDIPFSSLPVLGLIALVTAFASVLGDLAESMFKRVAGVKDSGNILPGHGGILDRIDSLTAAFPVFTVMYSLLS
ncbi:CDP-diglyceride synthetase [Veronia nyctiphanis]|uniref:Phosphatidate cytidylyltransferase n=1 Tax=Veronia nyctiphanis TaxID=1278244 RepID=A0A4Q0YNI7_9GAMM|nr:phosphatidate cytidylyltransferase [Veronia nyctiphanis]RXJ72507.1 CDP-diglyceride synthetase [Veronia nyctiphanis]